MENNIIQGLSTEQEEVLIERYLKGELSNEECAAFEERMKSDREFRTRAITRARLIKAMKEVGQVKDQDTIDALNATDAPTIKEIAKTTVSPIRQKLTMYRWLTIAASIVIVVCIGVTITPKDHAPSSEALMDMPASDFEPNTVRGETSDSIGHELLALFDNVKRNKDLDATIQRLSTLWELSTSDIYNDYTDYTQDIGWNLINAYLQKSDTKSALAVATKMNELYPSEKLYNLIDSMRWDLEFFY